MQMLLEGEEYAEARHDMKCPMRRTWKRGCRLEITEKFTHCRSRSSVLEEILSR